MDPKELVWVGTLTKTHGLKGEIKMLTNSDFIKERFDKGCKLIVNVDNETMTLVSKGFRTNKDELLISFEGYENIDQVSKFKSCKVYAPRNNKLDNKVYYDELIGYQVWNSKEVVGVIIGYWDQKAYYSLDVRLNDGKTTNVPIHDSVIVSIDKNQNRIIINDDLLETSE